MGQFVEGIDVRKSDGGMERIMTDRWLRACQPKAENNKENGDNDELIEGVFALGDAADIEGHELPATAEVAVQKPNGWLSI